MRSIIDELLEKIDTESGASARGVSRTSHSTVRAARSVARADLGMVLFAEREAINALWKTADEAVRTAGRTGDERSGSLDSDPPDGGAAGPAVAALAAAVERLRPLFGERG